MYTKAVTKDVGKLKDQKVIAKVETVLDAIKAASSLQELPALKKISGHPTAYRIRIGNYRLGLYYENETVVLVRFLKRNDIYKVFPS